MISSLIHVPDRNAVKLVNNAPQIPPTCFSFNMLPHIRQIAINKNEEGITTNIFINKLTVSFIPRNIANT